MPWKVLLGVSVLLLAGVTRSQANETLRPVGIGEPVASFELSDFRGKAWKLADFESHDILVVAFLGTECPLANQYGGRLAELAARYAGQPVGYVAIDSNQQDSLTELAHFARVHKIEFPVLKDPANHVADQFGAERTPEVFVLDRERRVRYHGRIDDQFTYGVQRPQAEHEYLRAAIDDLLAGREVQVATTELVGCHIGRLTRPDPTSDVTYSNQVSRILQDHCVECHRPGEIGPFSLTNYEEVVGWSSMLEEVVRQQRMPPWHADPQHGHFANDTRLSDEEKSLLYRWVQAGSPEGNSADLPTPRDYVTGWRIGQPDMVIKMSETPYQVPAKGEVKYQYFAVDPGFKEDKWIRSAECRPGNRAVVHHIIVAATSPERVASRLHGELESDWLAATAPGSLPMILPAGLAKRIPAGSKLVFQMHYTPNGTAQEDISSIGLIFADPTTVKQQVVTQKAANHTLRIPAGADNHRVEATHRFDHDSTMLAMFPHMHLRGKSFQYTAFYPDGGSEILLEVPHYDFNWQNAYVFAEPKRMPAGTRLQCVAHFDNSAGNLANPDPAAEVRWGDQTWEEMMIGYFDMVLTDQDLTVTPYRRRIDEFTSLVEAGKVQFDARLTKLAGNALESDESLKKFGVEMLALVPQVDRVDWITIENGTLIVRRAAQTVGFRRQASGLKVPAEGMKLAEFAQGEQTVVLSDLSEISSADYRLMSKLFASSMHVPVRVDGKVGVIGFWSTERNAFPEPAVQFLEQAARALNAPR